MNSREERKKLRGLKRLTSSLSYAFEGLIYAYKNEQSLTIHAFVTIFVITLGFILKINTFEWIIVILLITLVLVVELINTSIEAVVDLETKKIHPLAKIAKDTSAATSVIMSISSIIIGIIIFLPKLINILKGVI